MLKKISNLVLYKILFRIKEYNKPDLSKGKYIICPNHGSAFDGPIFWAGHENVRIMAKKECFDIPVIGSVLTSVDVVPVDRTSNPMAALVNAKDYLMEEEDKLFLMFPEGTVSNINETKISRIKPGAFFLAAHTGASIVPVFIEQPRLFRKSRIVYGESFQVTKESSQNSEGHIKYVDERKKWQDEVLKLQSEAEMKENRKVRRIKLDKRHRNNNN